MCAAEESTRVAALVGNKDLQLACASCVSYFPALVSFRLFARTEKRRGGREGWEADLEHTHKISFFQMEERSLQLSKRKPS